MKTSAGLLLYRRQPELQVFLVHPGGPFWARKDAGAWSIPKGLVAEGEDPLAAARREFTEETSFSVTGDFTPLGSIKQASGKVVQAWAVEGDCDPAQLKSNTFSLKGREYPEVDRAGWFEIDAARIKLLAGQRGFLDALLRVTRQP